MLPIILGLVALGGLLIVAKKKAPPTPGIPPIPPPVRVRFDVDELVEKIGRAGHLDELDTYYHMISEMLIKREVNYVEYMALYRAYETRYHELMQHDGEA